MAQVLVLATHNPGKVAEITGLLEGTGWEVRPLPETAPEYEETGATFSANARGKALFYSALTGAAVLADDSGLQIDALGGKPGVRSARYLDPAMPQAERNRRVLEMLRDVPEPQRTARFVCHLVLAVPGRIVHETTGVCAGRIAGEPAGAGGFGYDPIFVAQGRERTFAEIPRAAKAALSHRGHAVRAMARYLRGWEPPAGPPVVS